MFGLMVCHGDESGKGQDYFVVGGLTARADAWLRLENDWQAVLDQTPKLEYFKFKEAFSCSDQFRAFSPTQRNARVREFIRVINDHCFLGSAAICDVAKHKKLYGGQFSATVDQPFVATHTQLIQLVAMGLTEMGVRSKVDFVFDEMDETTLLEIRRAHQVIQFATRLGWEDRLGQLPITRDDKVVIALQAADLWAGAIRQRYEDIVNGKISIAKKWLAQIRVPNHINMLNDKEMAAVHEGTRVMMKHLKMEYETGKARSKRLAPFRTKRLKANPSEEERS